MYTCSYHHRGFLTHAKKSPRTASLLISCGLSLILLRLYLGHENIIELLTMIVFCFLLAQILVTSYGLDIRWGMGDWDLEMV